MAEGRHRVRRGRLGWIAATAVLAAGCGGDGGSDGDGTGTPGGSNSVTAAITLPMDASDTCGMIAVDDDTTGSNNSARRSDGTYLLTHVHVSGSSMSFTFDDVPEGTYYLWGYVDVNVSVSDPAGDCEIVGGPDSGDLLGYYDTGLRSPDSPNVTVPVTEGTTFEFELGVFP